MRFQMKTFICGDLQAEYMMETDGFIEVKGDGITRRKKQFRKREFFIYRRHYFYRHSNHGSLRMFA